MKRAFCLWVWKSIKKCLKRLERRWNSHNPQLRESYSTRMPQWDKWFIFPTPQCVLCTSRVMRANVAQLKFWKGDYTNLVFDWFIFFSWLVLAAHMIEKKQKKLIPVVFLVSCKKRVSGAFLSPHINLRFPSSVTSHLRSLRSCFFSASLSTRVSCSVFPSPFPLSVTVYPSFSTPFLSFRHIISCFRLDMHPSLNPRCLLACDTLLLNLIVFILKV